MGISNQRNIGPYRRVIKRVLFSNCVKRAFVNFALLLSPLEDGGIMHETNFF